MYMQQFSDDNKQEMYRRKKNCLQKVNMKIYFAIST